MQWFLLWLFFPKQTLQANYVDWGLDWLVGAFIIHQLPFLFDWDVCTMILTVVFISRFEEFGGPIHRRPVEDIAFAVARFIQKGGSFVNYYMV